LTAVRGNPHNAAGVKNKKLFERKASYFLFSLQVVSGSHGQAQPQKAFLVLIQLVVFRGFGQKKCKKL
jgi:hypothetical protein